MNPAASYVHGASATPLLGETVGALLDRIATRWPERPALVVRSQGVRWSYRQFHAEVERVAAGLLALGLKPGERVGIWAPNRAEWVVAQFAAPKAGLILVNINPAYRSHELEYSLNKVGCRALLLPRAFRSSHYLEILRELAPELDTAKAGALRAERLPDLREVILLDEDIAPGTRRWCDIVADDRALAHLRTVEVALGFDDPVNIQFTSGTTGAPKGATLTHHNIVNNGYFIGEAMRLTEHDRLCIPVPFYHCFGMVLGNLACVTHGACMVIPSEGFDALATLQTVAEEKCTGLHGVPTMFIAELEHPRFHEFDLGSLRTGIMAGSP
ncbi:MAG TPA: AMP-binding protein, partial [Luteibacter sp.]|nr:AMP-binding protein [Luteibacter sp.]